MKVQIALFKRGGPFGALIKWQTDSGYSHSGLLFNGVYMIEAELKGVVGQDYTQDELQEVELFDVDLDEESTAVIYEFAQAQIGKGYDFWALIRFISRSRFPENDRWFCSELVFAAFQAAEVYLLARTEAWRVSPGLLSRSPLLKEV